MLDQNVGRKIFPAAMKPLTNFNMYQRETSQYASITPEDVLKTAPDLLEGKSKQSSNENADSKEWDSYELTGLEKTKIQQRVGWKLLPDQEKERFKEKADEENQKRSGRQDGAEADKARKRLQEELVKTHEGLKNQCGDYAVSVSLTPSNEIFVCGEGPLKTAIENWAGGLEDVERER